MFTSVRFCLFIAHIALKGTTVPIFDVSLQNFFWQYVHQGQKNVQLRLC